MQPSCPVARFATRRGLGADLHSHRTAVAARRGHAATSAGVTLDMHTPGGYISCGTHTPYGHQGVMEMATASRRWWALGLIALAQFMVIMDTSIIGVALPRMRDDLGFTPGNLSWVFNAYVVAFGGLLLLGGRLSDLFGARRMFSTGWAILLAGSVAAGLADSVT